MFRFAAFLVLAIASCARNPAQPSNGASTDSLVRALQQQGATVARGGGMPHSAYPFFTIGAQRLLVEGEELQVFEYPDSTRADADGARVSSAGTPIGTFQVTWMHIPAACGRIRSSRRAALGVFQPQTTSRMFSELHQTSIRHSAAGPEVNVGERS